MTFDFWCPKCDNHVQVRITDDTFIEGWDDPAQVEAWCNTAHIRPVRMTTTDPHAT